MRYEGCAFISGRRYKEHAASMKLRISHMLVRTLIQVQITDHQISIGCILFVWSASFYTPDMFLDLFFYLDYYLITYLRLTS